MGHLRPLFHLFSSFQTSTILQQSNEKKCPSSIRCWDSNPQPLKHDSPPIITRPGLPPKPQVIFYGVIMIWLLSNFFTQKFIFENLFKHLPANLVDDPSTTESSSNLSRDIFAVKV